MRTPAKCIWAALGFWASTVSPLVRGDTLERIRQMRSLRWGADAKGGGPYIFERQGGQLTGFELDLAGLLAEKLGATPHFVQGDWDKLPNMLDRGDIDLVLNGYEWTPERAATMGATVPYYLYELQLLARAADPSLRSWEGLRAPKAGRRKRVGILGGSAAEKYLQETWADAVEIVSYDETTSALREVETGKIDATVQDLPAAVFYRDQFPKLRFVDEPRQPGYYVIYVRKGDIALRQALDAALIAALQDGSLRRIDEKYGIWSSTQTRLLDVVAHWPPRLDAASTVRVSRSFLTYGRKLVAAALVTVSLSVIAMPLAVALGLLIAIGRMYGPAPLRALLVAYVEVLRGTPLLLQLWVIYFGLSEIGLTLPAFWAAILGLAVNYSAYEAEIYRAGFQAVAPGQLEAALALGMSRAQAVRRIVAPQAVRIAIPGVTNDFIAMFKDSSLASVITVEELTKRYAIEVSNHPRDALTLGVLTAALYLFMSYPLSLFAGWVERRLGKEGPR